ncbi:MAG TPA: tetratricopeptide repeat protein, partial [Pyrinomonadaceae bacterium]
MLEPVIQFSPLSLSMFYRLTRSLEFIFRRERHPKEVFVMPLNLGRFALLSLMAWLLCCFIISPAGSTHPVHRAQEPTSNVDPVLKVQGDAADKEAFALYLNGDHQGALRRLADALALYRRARDRAGEANVLNGMGVIYASLNDFKKALKLYTEALSASEAAGNSAHGALVATLSSLGALYESLGEYQKGLEVLQRGLGIATKNGDRKGEGAVRHHLGIIHVRQGDYKQAVYHVEIALKIRRDEEQGDDFDVIATLNNLGLAYATTGRTQEGLARLGEALNMAHVAGAPKDGVKVYNSIGRVRTGTGEYREAVKAYESARSVNARFVRDIRSEFESLQGLGLAYLSQQKLNDALNYYQQATVVASKTGNPFDEGTAFQRLGFVYERLTQFDKALQHYTRALRLHERLGQRAGEGETLISIGGIHRQRGQFAEALSYYDRALAIATGLNDLDSKRIILNDTGEVYRSQGMYARALEFHQNSLRMSRETGNRIGEERSLGNIGGVYQSMGQPNTALGYYRQSLDIARSIGNRADEATNLNNIGNIALIYSSL